MRERLVQHCDDRTAVQLEADGWTIDRHAHQPPGAHWFWNPHLAWKRVASWRDAVTPARRERILP